MITLKYSQSRSPGETLINHPQGRCSSHTNNLLKSLGCNEDQAQVTRPALLCATASRLSNFQGESDWSQARGCTESPNHHTEIQVLRSRRRDGSYERKETLAYAEESERGNLLKYLFIDLGYIEVPLVFA